MQKKELKPSTGYIDWTCPTVDKIFSDLDTQVQQSLKRCGAKTRWAVLKALDTQGSRQIKLQVTYKFREALDEAIQDAMYNEMVMGDEIARLQAELTQAQNQLAQYEKVFGPLEQPEPRPGKFTWIIDARGK